MGGTGSIFLRGFWAKPERMVLAVGLAILLVLSGLAVNAYVTYEKDVDSWERALELQRIGRTISALDEVLTASARLAAESGDPQWERRYRQYEPELDAAIKQAARLAPNDTISASIQTIDKANLKLVDLEYGALAAAANHDLVAAHKLVFGEEYLRYKTDYAQGQSALLEELNSESKAEQERSGRRALWSVAAVALAFPLFLVAWFAVVRHTARHTRTHDELERNLRQRQGQLEDEVRIRTQDLEAANLSLRKEVEERKLAEQRVQERELKLKTVLDAAHDAIISVEESGAIVAANPAAARIFNYSESSLAGKNLTTLIPSLERRDEALELGTLAGVSCVLLGCRSDGSRFTAELTLSEGRLGNVRMFTVIVRDVTEREKALADVKRFKAVVDSAGDGIFIVDPNDHGRLIDVNETACSRLGYSRDELLRMHVPEIEVGSHFRTIEDWETVFAGARMLTEPLLVKGRHRRKDGTEFPVEVIIHHKVFDGRSYLLAMARDITEREELEQRMRQVQKMESLGVLAGGIAHDFNNVLMPILTYADMISAGTEPETAKTYAERISRSASRAKGLVQQILNFSRKKASSKVVISLTEAVRDAAELIRAGLSVAVELRLELDSKACPIIGDKTQIHQVLLNFCTNAAQAMPRGGTIDVCVQRVDALHSSDAERKDINAEAYIRLTVTDTGGGIPPDVLPRIFDPFFTTKGVGEGTGMGLSVVHGIVKAHGGTVTVSTEMGKGSTFIASFPAADVSARSQETEKLGKPIGDEHILLVDDEPDVRDAVEAMLIVHGYSVMACNAQEGLAAFMESPLHFSAMLVDYAMPGMNGIELSQRLLAVRPHFPIIMCSGYSSGIGPDEARRHGIRDYLLKPVAAGELLTALRKVMDVVAEK